MAGAVRLCGLHQRVDAGQRATLALDLIGNHIQANLFEPGLIGIGVENNAVGLRGKTRNYMGDQRLAGHRGKGLVDPGHAAPAAAGKNAANDPHEGCPIFASAARLFSTRIT